MSTQPYPQQSYPMETYPGYRQPPTQPPQPPQPPKIEWGIRYIVTAVVIVVLIIVLTFSLFQALPPTATVDVRIENSHEYEIHYELYMDGKIKRNGTIPPDYYANHTFTITLGSKCESHDFYATRVYGWPSPETDEDTISLCYDGDHEVITLTL